MTSRCHGQKFLDLKNVSKQRLGVNFFFFFFFLQYIFAGQRVVDLQKFFDHGNVTYRLLPSFRPMRIFFISIPAVLLSKIAQHNNLSTKTRMWEKKKGSQSRHPDPTFLLNPVIPWIFSESRWGTPREFLNSC